MSTNGNEPHFVALPQNVQEVEQLVKRLYQPGHPSLIANINDQLQQLQKSEHGWKLADELMGSEEQTARFYAALTFTVKLNNEGPSLDAETAQSVQSRLIHWTVRMVRQLESKMVLKKMCSTLATYFIRTPTPWRHPLLHLAAALQQGDAVAEPTPEDSGKATSSILTTLSEQQLITLMWFSATLAEDVCKVDFHTPANARLHTEMESIVQEATAILTYSFNQRESSEGNIEREAIACYGSWVNYAQPLWPRNPDALRYLRDLIPDALRCIYGEFTDQEALETFRDILESYTSFFEPTHMHLISRLINEYMQPILERAVTEKDPAGESYGRFVTAYGSANIKQVIEESSESKESGIVVKLVLDFMASDGYPGDELFLAFGSIEFWNTFIEYVNDEIFSLDTDDEQPKWASHAREVMKRVVELLWQKLWTPPPEVVKGWGDEEREMFSEYRQDASDLMLSIYLLLRSDMLRQLVNFTLSSLNAQEWRGVEAGMFCLNTLADNVTETPESAEPVAPIFQSSLFREVADFSRPIPAKVRRTTVDMLGSYSDYIESHPEFLPDTVTFLFTALDKAGLANEAAKSIEALCSTCRVHLTGYLPDFLVQYQRFLESPACETYTKQKVIGAIAAIAQALQPESTKAEPLLALLENVQNDIASAKQYAADGNSEMAEIVGISALECLASIGKGSQVPEDVPIDLDADTSGPNAPSHFWSTDRGQAVQQQIMSCFSVLQVVGNHGEAIEAVCRVLRCGFTETEPGPFVLPASVTVSFVQECSIHTPQLEIVLSTVGTLITQHSKKDNPRIDAEVTAIISTVIAFTQALDHPSQDPGVAMGCIEVLARTMDAYTDILFAHVTPAVLDFTIAALAGSNTFTKKATTDFWTRLFKPQPSTPSPDIQTRIAEILAAYGPKFTSVLMSQVGGNALRSDLEFLCEPLKAMLLHQSAVSNWLQQGVFAGEVGGERLSEQQKGMFLRQVGATRGDGGKLKLVVRQFWAAGRGTVLDYGS